MGDLETEFCCHAGYLSGVVALNAADADECIAALREGFGYEISIPEIGSLG